jgi:hypothetical protein
MYGANITSLHCSWPIPFFNDTLTWVVPNPSIPMVIHFLSCLTTRNISPIHWPFHSFCNEIHGNLLQWIYNWKCENQVNLDSCCWPSGGIWFVHICYSHVWFLFWWIFTLWQQNKEQCDSYKGFLLGKNGPKLPYFEETFLNLPYIACRF